MKSSDFPLILKKLQKTKNYSPLITDLRKNKRLHPFVEWRLSSFIRSNFSHHDLHIQPEKHGISNGRIDLVGYISDRAIVHFELIATSSSGHVFRDTTSLLNSMADSRLAILIDEDIDEAVARLYFRAIPQSVFPHVYLRRVLLSNEESLFSEQISSLISEAEFRSGSISRNGFYCVISDPTIKPTQKTKFDYFNAPLGKTLNIQIKTEDAIIPVGSVDVTSPNGEIEIWIPYSEDLIPGRHRIECKSNSGEKWARHIFISEIPPKPGLDLYIREGKVGDEIKYHVENFRPEQEVQLYFHMGNAGLGVGTMTTSMNGDGEGKFSVPSLLSGRIIRSGKYKVSASMHPRLEARAFMEIKAPDEPEKATYDCRIGTGNSILNFTITRIIVRPNEIDIGFEILNISNVSISKFVHAVNLINRKNPNNDTSHIVFMEEIDSSPDIIEPGENKKYISKLVRFNPEEVVKIEYLDQLLLQSILTILSQRIPVSLRVSIPLPLEYFKILLRSANEG